MEGSEPVQVKIEAVNKQEHQQEAGGETTHDEGESEDISSDTESGRLSESTNEGASSDSRDGKERSHNSPLKSVLGKRRRRRAAYTHYSTPTKYMVEEAPNFYYVETLNNLIDDASEQTRKYKKNRRYATIGDDTSQIGLTHWSPEEKEQLYDLLETEQWRGSTILPSAMESKSDIEVLHYLEHMKKKENQNLFPRTRLSWPAAASEISDSCCEALEKEASILAAVQWDYEWEKEQDKFGQYAVLTRILALDLEVALGLGRRLSKRPAPPPNAQLQPAAELFDLRNWLYLSARFFMPRFLNEQVHREENIELLFKEPSIFATAFGDFYNLVVNLTRRLISTAMTQALSRLIAEQDEHKEQYRRVLKRDVLAALDILSMDHNSISYWYHITRRLGIHVYRYNDRYLGGMKQANNQENHYYQYPDKDLMTVDEVEESLKLPYEASWSSSESEGESFSSEDLDDDTTDSEENIDGSLGEEVFADDGSLPDASAEDRPDLGDEETRSLEAADAIRSAEEENRLWTFLNHRNRKIPHWEGAEPDHVEIPRADLELGNEWPNQLDFRSDWERYGYCLKEDEFPPPHGMLGPSSARFRRVSKASALKTKLLKRRYSSSNTGDETEETNMETGPEDENEHALGGASADNDTDPEDVIHASGHLHLPVTTTNNEQSDMDVDNDENDDNESDAALSVSSRRSQRNRGHSQPNYVYEIPEAMPRSALESDSEDEYRPEDDK